jgi:hypothetical protein
LAASEEGPPAARSTLTVIGSTLVALAFSCTFELAFFVASRSGWSSLTTSASFTGSPFAGAPEIAGAAAAAAATTTTTAFTATASADATATRTGVPAVGSEWAALHGRDSFRAGYVGRLVALEQIKVRTRQSLMSVLMYENFLQLHVSGRKKRSRVRLGQN